jgi:S1-C subfamily serine protease
VSSGSRSFVGGRSAFLATLTAAVMLLAWVLVLGGGTGARAASSAAGPTTGVVDVNTTLGYERGSAAGTGIVLTSSGEVLTNNHVIRGATSIRVVVPATGRSYTAFVAGYSLTADIALLKLSNASGLKTATIGNSAGVELGDRVKAVGNAGGRGGVPVVTAGSITALHRSITVGDDHGGAARLTDLIGTSASLEPGDSGGPLLDASGRVIGVDAAAETGFTFDRGATGGGYAIPINRAIAVVKTIEAGHSTATVHVGPTSFLGVNVAQSDRFGDAPAAGALVSGVLSGSPADRAGIAAGDVITSVAGRKVTSPPSLVAALLHTKPGAPVRVGWVDRLGAVHSATVRPLAGPPQ